MISNHKAKEIFWWAALSFPATVGLIIIVHSFFKLIGLTACVYCVFKCYGEIEALRGN